LFVELLADYIIADIIIVYGFVQSLKAGSNLVNH